MTLQDGEIVQPEHLEPLVAAGLEADMLLFRFGYGPVRRSDPLRCSLKSLRRGKRPLPAGQLPPAARGGHGCPFAGLHRFPGKDNGRA